MRRITGHVRRCIDDYAMIRDGDRIAVGVSGGKDSLVLLCALAALRRYYPRPYELEAVTVDLGFEGADFSSVEALCSGLEIPFTLVKTDISQVVFETREETNPCSLCAKMRKGALIGAALDRGCNKVALGHHYDDAVETMMMSLVFEGRLSCFSPVSYMDRRKITQIRPLLYVHEHMSREAAERNGLTVLKSGCPMDGTSKRQEIKELVASLDEKYPGLKGRIFGAMQRLPLKGWGLS